MSHVMSQSIAAAYCERFPQSQKLHERGCSLFPNGVTHDGRYLKPFPIYVNRASGSKKYTVEGREIVDCWSGHGALLLGHSHPAVVEAVQKQVALGTHFGACHELELQWGEWVRRLVPSAEMMRFTSSGTEATLMALRVARIVTGRNKVLKFAGHFHGWHDQLIPAADPPHAGDGYPTPGVTDGMRSDLIIVPPNDLEAVERELIAQQPACVILEPTGGRWGVVPIRGEFLRGLREITRKHNVLLICDEVITGFRVSPGGAQAYYDIVPDLTTMAKILAGGLPGGCLAGRADLLQAIAFDNPLGKKMKHPGTFNANPLSAAAGIAALEVVSTGEPCRRANETGAKIRAALNAMFAEKSAQWVAYGDFSGVKICPDYDGPRPTRDDFIPFDGDLQQLDRKYDPDLLHNLRAALLIGGVDWMGWHGMLSAPMDDNDIDTIVSAFASAIDMLRQDGLIA